MIEASHVKRAARRFNVWGGDSSEDTGALMQVCPRGMQSKSWPYWVVRWQTLDGERTGQRIVLDPELVLLLIAAFEAQCLVDMGPCSSCDDGLLVWRRDPTELGGRSDSSSWLAWARILTREFDDGVSCWGGSAQVLFDGGPLPWRAQTKIQWKRMASDLLVLTGPCPVCSGTRRESHRLERALINCLSQLCICSFGVALLLRKPKPLHTGCLSCCGDGIVPGDLVARERVSVFLDRCVGAGEIPRLTLFLTAFLRDLESPAEALRAVMEAHWARMFSADDARKIWYADGSGSHAAGRND